MFFNIFALILSLLVISLGFDTETPDNDLVIFISFCKGMIQYTLIMLLIILQNTFFRRKKPERRQMLTKLSISILLGFLMMYHFVYSSQYFYLLLPSPLRWRFFSVVWSLTLYFVGVWITFYTLPHESIYGRERRRHASNGVRFLVPFILPFFVLEGFADLFNHAIPVYIREALYSRADTVIGLLLTFLVTGIFLALMLIFTPPIIQWFWRCAPLPDTDLKKRLDRLCDKANFKHAGIKMWTVMNKSVTAAIIGVVGRFRYVMFTKGLLNRLNDDEIEAVLAHEIGHSYHHHLRFYPFIIFGLVILTGIFFGIFGPMLTNVTAIGHRLYPAGMWQVITPFFYIHALCHHNVVVSSYSLRIFLTQLRTPGRSPCFQS